MDLSTQWKSQKGFTILELLVIISIIGFLSLSTLSVMRATREKAYLTLAQAQIRQIVDALEFYLNESGGAYPPDEVRDIPPELVPYLGVGNWPAGPWPGSVFDWENWTTASGEKIYQISVRFCPIGSPVADCRFPDQAWVDKPTQWIARSGVYYCISGPCRAHIDSITIPGYCLNCAGCQSTPCP